MPAVLRCFLLVSLLVGGGNTAFGEPIWSDEFDTGTSLDSAVWSYDLGASGWGNQELQEYTDRPENVRVEDGNLVITVQESTDGGSSSFTSARVRTQDKLTFKYGTIEARIRMPDLADGLWPAFWTLGNNFSEVGWPRCGELDIMEMGSSSAISQGVINRRVGSAAHWDNDGSWASYARSFDAPADLDDEFHIFSMDWTPERVTTYIDGQLVWTFFIREGACASCSEFHEPHFIILNMAVGGTYTGLLDSGQITASTPAEMRIDYVRIHANEFTELGGSSIPEEPVPGQEYSGSWFNPQQSGHGFSMEFGRLDNGPPLAAIYWYTYDTSGNPVFLAGNGVLVDGMVRIQLEVVHGMRYGEYDPDSVVREDGGIAVFEFSDASNATFSYTPSAYTTATWGHTAIESLSLQKLFSVPVSGAGNSSQ